MNITFENALLAGNGTIHITGSAAQGAEVEFASVNTMGFTGVFRVHDYGRLNLPLIIPEQGILRPERVGHRQVCQRRARDPHLAGAGDQLD